MKDAGLCKYRLLRARFFGISLIQDDLDHGAAKEPLILHYLSDLGLLILLISKELTLQETFIIEIVGLIFRGCM